jgi:hypothetical protein
MKLDLYSLFGLCSDPLQTTQMKNGRGIFAEIIGFLGLLFTYYLINRRCIFKRFEQQRIPACALLKCSKFAT